MIVKVCKETFPGERRVAPLALEMWYLKKGESR